MARSEAEEFLAKQSIYDQDMIRELQKYCSTEDIARGIQSQMIQRKIAASGPSSCSHAIDVTSLDPRAKCCLCGEML